MRLKRRGEWGGGEGGEGDEDGVKFTSHCNPFDNYLIYISYF